MRLPVILALVALLAAGALLLGHLGGLNGTAQQGPRILSITFPKRVSADGSEVTGKLNYMVPSGNVVKVDFEVVKAGFFVPFSFDPQISNTPRGTISFYLSTIVPQSVTLRVTISDDQGNVSPAKSFSFTATASSPVPATPGTTPSTP